MTSCTDIETASDAIQHTATVAARNTKAVIEVTTKKKLIFINVTSGMIHSSFWFSLASNSKIFWGKTPITKRQHKTPIQKIISKTSTPQTQESWYFIHWRSVRGILTGYHLKAVRCWDVWKDQIQKDGGYNYWYFISYAQQRLAYEYENILYK